MSQYQYNPDQIDKNVTPVKDGDDSSKKDKMFFLTGEMPKIYYILGYLSAYILLGDVVYTFGFQFVEFDFLIGLTELLYCYLPPVVWQIAGSVVMIFYFGGLLVRFSRVSLIFQLSSLAFIALQIIYILVLVQAAPENPLGLVCTLPLYGCMNNSPYATYQLIIGILFIALLIWVPYSMSRKTGEEVGLGGQSIAFSGGLFLFFLVFLFLVHLLIKALSSEVFSVEIGNGFTADLYLTERRNGTLYKIVWFGCILTGGSLAMIIFLISDYLPKKFKRGDQEEVDSADIQVVGVDTTTDPD